MSYHKLPDVQHALRWVEVVLGESGCCSGDIESLRNGVIFCRVAASLLDHCVDLSQVRRQGNAELSTLHNLALLNRALQRYSIKMPSKLQVDESPRISHLALPCLWLTHVLQAAFESIGKKRSSVQHIVNLLMSPPPPSPTLCHSAHVSIRNRQWHDLDALNRFTGGCLSISRALKVGIRLQI